MGKRGGQLGRGSLAYMPSALLLNSLLEDGLTLSSLNHVIHLLLSRPLSSHNQSPPFNDFPAERNKTLRCEAFCGHTVVTGTPCLCQGVSF